MPFSSPPELLGNSPRGDLATWYFPPLFPAWHIHDLILCTTLRAAQTHFRAHKSPAPLMACSVQAQGHLLTYTGYVYIYLCMATQMFNGLDVSKFRKTCQEKEKKKKEGLQHMNFAAWYTDGPRSREYLYFHSHFKGKQFPKPFSPPFALPTMARAAARGIGLLTHLPLRSSPSWKLFLSKAWKSH